MKNRKGFTITELVIVIAVIAILAAVLIPTFSNVITKANKNSALQTVRNAYTQYVSDNAQSGDLEEKVYVEIDGYIVKIDNGQCVIVDSAPASGYVQMEVANNTLTEVSTPATT